MPDFLGSNNDPFAVLGQDTGPQRTQIAQYSIIRAASYLKDGKKDEALKEFKKALAFDPQNLTAQTYIGKINLAKGNNQEAIKAFQTILKNKPNSVDTKINLANAFIQDKQYANAEKELKAASRLDPQNPLPDYTLGQMYTSTGRLSEAETEFLKVKKISPNDGNVYYALGMVYNKQGRYGEAAATLEKSLTLKKKFAPAYYELGVAYNGLGRADDAQKQLSILKTLDSTQASNLQFVLNKPSMVYMSTKNSGGFLGALGPGTPLWMLDPALLTPPNSGKTFSVTIGFSTPMNAASITNTQNWTISRANSPKGGYYNNTMPLSSKDAVLPLNPQAVFYNSLTGEATIQFRINQNAAGNAVIDPSHVVFKFSGKDAAGRSMAVTADEIDGYSINPF